MRQSTIRRQVGYRGAPIRGRIGADTERRIDTRHYAQVTVRLRVALIARALAVPVAPCGGSSGQPPGATIVRPATLTVTGPVSGGVPPGGQCFDALAREPLLSEPPPVRGA